MIKSFNNYTYITKKINVYTNFFFFVAERVSLLSPVFTSVGKLLPFQQYIGIWQLHKLS